MKLKPLILTSIMGSMLTAASASVLADESTFKVAIIKSPETAANISEGEYKEIIANLSTTKAKGKYDSFEKNTALCVAYLKTNNISESEPACSSAIESAQTLNLKSKKASYLQSISYSNRAIARYLKGDVDGAMSDLTTADSINSNKISRANLEVMSSKFDQSGYDESTSLAD